MDDGIGRAEVLLGLPGFRVLEACWPVAPPTATTRRQHRRSRADRDHHTSAVTAGSRGEPVQLRGPGLAFDGVELREGNGPARAAANVALLVGTPLDADVIVDVLDRLPPLDADAAAAPSSSGRTRRSSARWRAD